MTNYRFLRFPGGRERAFTMSYDDGVGTDLRLMDIMRKNGLRGTFNISAGFLNVPSTDLDPEKNPTGRFSLAQIKKYYKDFEIATHGYTHAFYNNLPLSAVVADIVHDREALEAAFGRIIRGHAYPNREHNPKVMDALRACGILYGRSAGNSDSFEIPTDFLDYMPSSHHNNPKLFELWDAFLAEPTYHCQPKLFGLWGHSYEFQTHNNWDRIEEFAARAGGHENVWYAGMEEVFSYIEAYRHLVYSMDSRRIYNPTATEIALAVDSAGRETVTLAPGETVTVSVP